MFARLVVALVAAGALTFAGCGGGGDDDDTAGDDTGSSKNATRTPRPTRTPTPADPRDSVHLPKDACELLAEAEIVAFSDQLAPTDPLGGNPQVWKGCQWQYNSGRDWGTLSVEVRKFYESETAEAVKARFEEDLLASGRERVEGVGQVAVLRSLAGSAVEADALLDNLVISVSWTNPASEDKKALLIETLKLVAERVE